MSKIANIIGATGLVGKQLVNQLLENENFSEVKIFVRRTAGISHPKLKEYLIDFDQPDEWRELITGDVLFSTLGTTLKTAGSKENQYKVDFTYQYSVASIAAGNGIAAYVLVSSVGANPKSRVFYSRIKGELDEAVSKLNFRNITVLRPSILNGNRIENRPTEKMSIRMMSFITRFMLKKYRPIKDEFVARAMINASLFQNEKYKIVALEQVFNLAETI